MKEMHESIWHWETDTRYYYAKIGVDLFGGIVLDRCWGGKFNRRGGMNSTPYSQREQAERAVEALAKTRLQHGYRQLC